MNKTYTKFLPGETQDIAPQCGLRRTLHYHTSPQTRSHTMPEIPTRSEIVFCHIRIFMVPNIQVKYGKLQSRKLFINLEQYLNKKFHDKKRQCLALISQASFYGT